MCKGIGMQDTVWCGRGVMLRHAPLPCTLRCVSEVPIGQTHHSCKCSALPSLCRGLHLRCHCDARRPLPIAAMSSEDAASVEGPIHDVVVSDATASCAPLRTAQTCAASASDQSMSETPGTTSRLLSEIKRLRETQKALQDTKKELSKQMKNAMKRKRRLQSKACLLTDADLVEVLHMRQARTTEGGSPSARQQRPCA